MRSGLIICVLAAYLALVDEGFGGAELAAGCLQWSLVEEDREAPHEDR